MTYEKMTVVEHGHLFEGADCDDYLRSLTPGSDDWLASFTVANLLPDEARGWERGRFEITVKFTPEEP